MLLRVRHSTLYRYRNPVTLAPHRLMLRPRDSHALRLLKTGLVLSPPASVLWSLDVFGNSVAVATFAGPATELRIDSELTVELFPTIPDPLQIDNPAATYPFVYSGDDVIDLGGFLKPHYDDPDGRLEHWARGFVMADGTGTLALLTDMNAGIKAQFAYRSRDEEGTQTPLETLERGSGSCRDFAVLLVDAARHLGFGARLVSGYLDTSRAGIGQGATHAWADIYLPGAGWTTFDPTNAIVGEEGLIRVAVGREMGQIVPVSGSFTGAPGDFLGMTAQVEVAPAPDPQDGNQTAPPSGGGAGP
jgi:Transglutaminase-like enzymes, putative cysteine proteases